MFGWLSVCDEEHATSSWPAYGQRTLPNIGPFAFVGLGRPESLNLCSRLTDLLLAEPFSTISVWLRSTLTPSGIWWRPGVSGDSGIFSLCLGPIADSDDLKFFLKNLYCSVTTFAMRARKSRPSPTIGHLGANLQRFVSLLDANTRMERQRQFALRAFNAD